MADQNRMSQESQQILNLKMIVADLTEQLYQARHEVFILREREKQQNEQVKIPQEEIKSKK